MKREIRPIWRMVQRSASRTGKPCFLFLFLIFNFLKKFELIMG